MEVKVSTCCSHVWWLIWGAITVKDNLFLLLIDRWIRVVHIDLLIPCALLHIMEKKREGAGRQICTKRLSNEHYYWTKSSNKNMHMLVVRRICFFYRFPEQVKKLSLIRWLACWPLACVFSNSLLLLLVRTSTIYLFVHQKCNATKTGLNI